MDYTTYLDLFCTIPSPTIKPEVPLYRYRGNAKHALDEIRKQYVFTNYAGDQNDPFDSCYRMTYEEAIEYKQTVEYFFLTYWTLKSMSCYQRLRESFEKRFSTEVSLRQFSESLSYAFKEEGIARPAEKIARFYYDHCMTTVNRRNFWKIACFSEKRDSIPMWAYYAANHTGLCLKYDFGLLDKEEQYNRCIMESLHKVWYTNNRPLDPDGTFSYLIKAQDWSHEQEWRLVNWRNTDQISLPCITEVYLGIKAPLELFASTIDAIKASGRDIKLFHCYPNLQEYCIEFQAINLSTWRQT